MCLEILARPTRTICGTAALIVAGACAPLGPEAQLELSTVEHTAQGWIAAANVSWSEAGSVMQDARAEAVFFRSDDGEQWTAEIVEDRGVVRNMASDGRLTLAASSQTTFVGNDRVAESNLLVSVEGGSFTPSAAELGQRLRDVTWGGAGFVALTDPIASDLWHSQDGATFSLVLEGGDETLLTGVAFVHGAYYAYGTNEILRSVDGQLWERFDVSPVTVTWVGELDGEVVGYGNYDCCYGELPGSITYHLLRWREEDGAGASFEQTTLPSGAAVIQDAVTVGGERLVVGGDVVRLEGDLDEMSGETVLTPPLAITSSSARGYASIATDGERVVTVGAAGLALSTDGGLTFRTLELPAIDELLPSTP